MTQSKIQNIFPMTPRTELTTPPQILASPGKSPEQREYPVSTPSKHTNRKPKPPPVPKTRPTRLRQAPSRYGYDGSGNFGYQVEVAFCPHSDGRQHSNSNPNELPLVPKALQTFLAALCAPEDLPAAFKARAVKDPDTLTFEEAMRSPERKFWMAAAQGEVTSLESKGTWTEVPMSQAEARIIPGTWVFRIKRAPSGEIKKFKARYCVRGDLEEDNGEDNFAPVVSWSTVRLFLVLCFLLGWTTASIDFTNAFVQSILTEPIWIHLPRGFTSKLGQGTCLRLSRSLYGLRRSPKLFSETALDAFRKLGFTQSVFDPCLLFKPGMMIVMYVDDCGIGAANPKDIDRLVDDLRSMGFDLTREGDFSEFLGIKMVKLPDGSIQLTQKGLIDKIIKTTGMEESKPNYIPATNALSADLDGPPMAESWSYSSIIGMLLYLSTNTRCDIAFAVSQAARFAAKPRQSHATAIKTIIRYLKRTREQGMILKPTGTLDLDLYVDADFCGLFKVESDTNSDAARSRTGFIVVFSGFPLIWKSQLQASIACSTLEAEYTALSYSLKAFLPIKRMLYEAVNFLQISTAIRSSIRARVFEDNQGAYLLARNHRITNRTRYFLNKWHWFWEHAEEFELYKVDTKNQRADYFTKALTREPFENNRLQVQGW